MNAKQNYQTKLQNQQIEQANTIKTNPWNTTTLTSKHINILYLDTNCNNYKYKKKELFLQLNESIKWEVNFESKSKVLIISKGNIQIYSNYRIDINKVDIYIYIYYPRFFFWIY